MPRNTVVPVVVLGSAAVIVGVAGLRIWHDRGLFAGVTFVTGYLAIGLLAITLLIGPARRLTRRRTPVHIRVRRRLGVTAALMSGVHTGIGLQVHFGGDIVRYFTDGRRLVLDQFRFANWTGLAALLALLPAFLVSSDPALAWLGVNRWKRLQRLTLLAAPLALLHSIAYAHIRAAWAWIAALAIGGAGIGLVRLVTRSDRGIARRPRK